MKSTADFLVTNGRPSLALNRWSFLLSNLTRIKLQDVDFGWGKAVYGGDANNTYGKHLIPFTNNKGEDGIVVPLNLLALIMERFVNELNSLLKNENPNGNHNYIKSNM
ncbi:benzyl alcohol O-benzoyltransferase-like isoform X2 [Gossypium australe]|uniref:Benzyl alcohol O-benzoyltransferase-like isoform X2 n=1 Tax=Gossypium australe TaxID=47621 RepID=A0A5B6VWV0_9ROSI|nr:benzyl alcohol O-benzoyltransferase-like isoform X2 [Gossypium australe]